MYLAQSLAYNTCYSSNKCSIKQDLCSPHHSMRSPQNVLYCSSKLYTLLTIKDIYQLQIEKKKQTKQTIISKGYKKTSITIILPFLILFVRLLLPVSPSLGMKQTSISNTAISKLLSHDCLKMESCFLNPTALPLLHNVIQILKRFTN